MNGGPILSADTGRMCAQGMARLRRWAVINTVVCLPVFALFIMAMPGGDDGAGYALLRLLWLVAAVLALMNTVLLFSAMAPLRTAFPLKAASAQQKPARKPANDSTRPFVWMAVGETPVILLMVCFILGFYSFRPVVFPEAFNPTVLIGVVLVLVLPYAFVVFGVVTPLVSGLQSVQERSA